MTETSLSIAKDEIHYDISYPKFGDQVCANAARIFSKNLKERKVILLVKKIQFQQFQHKVLISRTAADIVRTIQLNYIKNKKLYLRLTRVQRLESINFTLRTASLSASL